MIEVRAVRADQPPADGLVAAMVAEITVLYGPLDARNAPTATPTELWAPGGTYLVLSLDGEPVAGGGVKQLAPGLGEVKRMYVAPAGRGQGLARRLLYELEDAARALGHVRLRLDTGPQQPHARKLYAGTDYREIPDYNGNVAATFWGEKDLALCGLDLRRHPTRAAELLALQRAAYLAESELVGFGIPTVRETPQELQAEPQSWLGRFAESQLVGALASLPDDDGPGVEITRLVVDPAHHRRGHGRALLAAFLERHPDRSVRVMTASANAPAVALYAAHGFATEREEEIAPGVRVTRLVRAAG